MIAVVHAGPTITVAPGHLVLGAHSRRTAKVVRDGAGASGRGGLRGDRNPCGQLEQNGGMSGLGDVDVLARTRIGGLATA